MTVAPVRDLRAPTLAEIRTARERLDGIALRTPLLRLEWEPPAAAGAPPQIYLKLESLQPIGSFKLRGATNAMLQAAQAVQAAPAGRESPLAGGVYTASAGNMAQGVAWGARRLGVAATAIVPDHAPATKLAAIERLGGTVVKVPFERWWQVIVEHRYPGMPGLFIHPVSDTAVMAGNGTIGLEIMEQLPGVDLVLVPFGGGGLSCGIAAALRELRPQAAVHGCEVTTAAPLAASLAAGAPRTVDYQPSFVDGIGGKALLPEMWPIVSRLLAGSHVVPVAAVAAAVRLLAERHRIIAEGAGATAVAAAMALAAAADDAPDAGAGPAAGGAGGEAGAAAGAAKRPAVAGRKIVCIVSGGNIDAAKLATILTGGVP
ncbi:MAG TPA: pyridoxal-phosphate dependent enzyme [Thermoanaerobaculia bacterium]|nr:pyridoxal-phosphate dependent enzyme [Thermoanaerobaculia bacterium]